MRNSTIAFTLINVILCMLPFMLLRTRTSDYLNTDELPQIITNKLVILPKPIKLDYDFYNCETRALNLLDLNNYTEIRVKVVSGDKDILGNCVCKGRSSTDFLALDKDGKMVTGSVECDKYFCQILQNK